MVNRAIDENNYPCSPFDNFFTTEQKYQLCKLPITDEPDAPTNCSNRGNAANRSAIKAARVGSFKIHKVTRRQLLWLLVHEKC